MADYKEHLATLDAEPDNAAALAALERLAATTSGPGGLVDTAAAQALDEARRAHRERGNLELVARLYDVEFAASHDRARRAFLLLEKGRLLKEDMLDVAAAVECFQRVLEVSPEDDTAQQMLAEISLEQANWEKFVRKYVDEARVQTDRQLTTSLYLSAAETMQRYQPGAGEVEQYLAKALEIEPRNRRAAIHLARLYAAAERWDDLAALLSQRVDAAAARDERVQALVSLADLARGRLNRADVAMDCLKKVVALDPAHPRALRALVEAYSREENWPALVKLYEGALKVRRSGQTHEQELAIYLQIAMIHWRNLGQADAAEEYFRRIRKFDPSHPAAIDFYRSYHKDRGEGAKLLQVLQQAQKAEQDPERRTGLAVEIAVLAEETVGNPEKAIDSWKAILRADPRNPEARAALKRLYQKTEKWNALLELLKEEVEAISIEDEAGKRTRVERLLDVVAIYRDRLNLDVMVINTYNNILQLVSDHAGALDSLAQKYEQLGRWNDLISVLQRKSDATQDRGEKAGLLRRIAALWTDRFGNAAQAIKPLEELLELEPTDAEALAKLKDIYYKRRQWRSLLDLLGREAAGLPAAERRTHLVEMARLAAEKLGDARAAIAIWNRVLEDDPADGEALAALAALYERDKRHHALAEILHRQRDALGASDPKAAAALLERLGNLYAERLEAPAQAAAAFKEVLELTPGHARSLRVLRDLYAQSADYDALEHLYASLNAFDDLLDVLHAVADRVPGNDQKLAVLGRIARVAEERMGAPEKAARAHERVLTIDPQNLPSARALVPIYRKTEKWARLLSTQEVLLAHADSTADKLALLEEIRKLCEERLGSKALAFQWCARAYELAPDDEKLLRELERLGAESDAWEQVADILQQRIDTAGVAAEEQLRLLRELGRIRAVRLHRPDDARAAWDQVLKIEPDDPEAMAALEEIATQEGRWPDLLAIYRRRAAHEQDVPRRLEMLFKIAFIEEERVGDLDGASRTYGEILEIEPHSQRALRALAKVNAARADHAGLARVLEMELEMTTEADQRTALHLRVGGLYEEYLHRRDDALRHYREALAQSQTNRQVHGALERFVAGEAGGASESSPPATAEERLEVARVLAPVYERTDEPRKLAQSLEILRAAEDDTAERLALDRRLVGLYARRLKEPLDAYEAATRVLAAAPEDTENRRELQVLAGELAAFDDLVTHLAKVLDADPPLDAPVRREIAAELAELWDERLARPVEAEAAWRRVLELDAADERAYDALERLLRAAGRWDDLRELLTRREENTPQVPRRLEILLQICDLYEGVLDTPAGAMQSYRRVLDLDPTLLRAYKALERLYEGAGEWRLLEELLGAELSHVDDAVEQRQLSFRRAALRAERLDDAAGAVDLCEEVLSADPAHGDARQLLESLFDRSELKLRIARLLEPLYEGDGLWADLVRMLRGELEHATGTGEAVDLTARIATILEERLGDESGAYDAWVEAVKTDPADERSRQALERLARFLDRWPGAAAAWEEAIARTAAVDVSLRATLIGEVAAIYDRYLGDAGKATDAYRRLLDTDPGNLETARTAAEALERLYAEQEDWAHLIEILRRQADWTDASTDRRASFFYRVAAIHEEKLQDVPAAIATWRDVLGEDPENAPALDALERLHASRGEARELVEVLRRRVELAAEPEGKRGLLMRIAGLSERELSEVGEAVAAYMEILDFLPEDRDTLAELSRLYRQEERWADLLEVDERRLSLCTDPVERTSLRFEIAELLRDKLERTEEALERFREILAETPPEPEAEGEDPRARRARAALTAVEAVLADEDLRLRACEILKPIYASSADYGKLVELFELEVKALEDVRERIIRLRRIADLRERHLGDADGAFVASSRACREALAEPELKDLLGAVQRLAIERDRIPDLVVLYRELAPDVLDGELQRRMCLDIADLARGKLHDAELAKEYYRRVLDGQPDDARALDALEVLHREAQEWEPLREVLQRKVDLAAEDLDARYGALLEIATICEEKLELEEDAISAWEAVLEFQPADQPATRALTTLYTKRERWIELAELLEKRLGFAEDLAEAVELRFRLGEIYEGQLHDPERAVENYEAALGGDASHAGAITALERYLEDPATRLEVASVLEPIYIARLDWPNLIRITEIRLDAEVDPASRLLLTKRIARLYEEQLEDLEGAFRWYGKVFREDPEERSTRDQLVRLATILERWDGLALVYQEYLDDQGGDSPAVREVAKSLAEIYDRRLGEVERARSAYRRVLEAQPDDLDAFDKLEAMLTRAERWFALVDTYQDAIDAALDGDRRKDLYARIARVQEQRLGAADRAVDAWRSILDMDADDEQACAELDRLYQEQSRWTDLADLLMTRIDRATSPEIGAALRVRLAEVLEQKIGEIGSAIDQYEQVLAQDDGNAAAIGALERLVLVEEHRSRIASILEPIYRTHDWWQKLVVILDAQLAYVDDRVRRVDMLREIARLHETRGGNVDLAMQAMVKAWKEDVADDEVYGELARLAESLGAWADLVTALDGGVEGTYDYDLAARLLARIAVIEETQRADRLAAIAAWRRVLEVKDDDAAALDALERLHAAEAQFDKLVEILEKKAELAADAGLDVGERKALHHRIADLYERTLGKREEAIAAWKQALVLDDADGLSLDALDRLYREEKDFRALSEILWRKIDLAADGEARRPLRFALAKIQDEELADTFEAISQLKAVLDEVPGDPEALEGLDRLYEREKSWLELVEVLDRRAELSFDTERKADLLFRAARVVEKEQIEVGQAIERYRTILEYVPAHADTRAALDALTRSEDTLEAAAAALEPVYRADGMHDALAELYERRLAATALDLDGRRASFAALAEVHESGRNDLAAAFGVWARALRESPEELAVQGELERLAQVRGEWLELARLYEEVLEATMDAELGRSLAMKLATVYEEAIGDLEKAARWYRKALDLTVGEGEMVPLAALDRIYEREGKWTELAEILGREALAAESDEDQAAFLYRLGDVRERELGDAAGAVSAYRDVLDRVRGHEAGRAALERLLASPQERASVIAILEPLYEDDQDHARLADLLEAKLTVEDSALERASLLARVASIAEDRLGDPVRALDAVGRWLAEDPQSEEAATQLERLAGAQGRWEEAAARLADVAAASTSPDVQRDLALRLGRVLLDSIRDPGRAEPAFCRVLELDAQSGAALGALERIYRSIDDPAKLAAILWRRGEGELDLAAKRKDFAETAVLREERLGDLEGAVTAWKEVLDLDEGDREAHARLAAIYGRTEQWDPLVDILGLAARFARDGKEELQLKRQAAEVLADKMEALDRAVDVWLEVADLAPEDTSVLLALEAVHRRRRDWLAVQETLARRLGIAETPRERVAILTEMARLAEVERNSPDEAIGYLHQILEVDNSQAEAYAGLERLLAAGERWHDLIEVLSRNADVRGTLGDGNAEIELLLKAADVWELNLLNPDAAAEILEKVHRREPQHVGVLTRLARIYEAASDWDKCGTILQRALALGPTGRDAADLHYRLGRVAEAQTGDLAQALPSYHRALEFDRWHLDAIAALERAARDAGDWAAVADLVARREAAEQDPKKKLALALELAEVYRTRLGRAADAVPYLERVVQAEPDDAAAAEQLAELYFAAGRGADAEPIFRRLADKAKASRRLKEMGRFLQRLGALRESAGDPGEAIKAYEDAFRVDPSHAPTMAGLGRLYFAQADWEKARRVYRSMLLQNLDPSAGVSKADVYLQLGRIHAHMGEAPKAKSMFERGLEIEPNHAELRAALSEVK